MFIDSTYLIFVGPALLLSLWASARVKSTFNKYSKIASHNHMTGAEAASRLLKSSDISDVQINKISGQLSDFYDPQKKTASLSVYDDSSVAGISVACHEIGHAIQHHDGYFPVKLRTAIVPITNFGAKICMPLIIIGIIISSTAQSVESYNLAMLLIDAGILCFGLSVFFQLVTLPVEFDASRRALAGIEELGLLTEDELPGAKAVLKAAAWTYVAALAVALAQFLRFIVLFAGNRRR